MSPSETQPGAPLRVCSFESRRGDEMRALIVRQGAAATVAPSMREVPLQSNGAAFDFARRLLAGEIDVVVFMTGVGARALLEVVETQFDRGAFLAALDRCRTVVRGPKPAAVLREWGKRIDHRVLEPNTWRELLDLLDAECPVSGRAVAVQEYGEPNDDFYRELERRGARLLRVPVYRWALPEDTSPLLASIRDAAAGRFDVLLFTSAAQLQNILMVAEAAGLRDAWTAAAARCVIGSIGPTCSERLAEAGLPPDFEPSHPKMGHLVIETLREAPRLLASKRSLGLTS